MDERLDTETSAPAGSDELSGRGKARRRAMLDAARELFLEHGFEGTSVGEVVRRSGGSLATLYACFGSKEGLFEAIIGDLTAETVAPLEAAELEDQPLEERLRDLGQRFLALVLTPAALGAFRISVVEGAKFPDLRAAMVRTGPARMHERLSRFLADQARAGRLRVEDPDVAAHHFFALTKSESHFAAVCGEPIDLSPAQIADQVRRAVDVFLRGYSLPCPTPQTQPARARRPEHRSPRRT